MKHLPFPATTPSFKCKLVPHLAVWPLLRLSAQFRRYPMHMRLNGASKTLIWLIEGVLSLSHLIQCKDTVPRQQSDRYSASEQHTTAARPQNELPESADEVDFVAARRPLWMVVWPWLPWGVWSFWPLLFWKRARHTTNHLSWGPLLVNTQKSLGLKSSTSLSFETMDDSSWWTLARCVLMDWYYFGFRIKFQAK